MEAVSNNVRLNYNYNLEYANKAIQNYRRVSPTETPKQPERTKEMETLQQKTQQFSRTDINNTSKVQDATTIASFTPVASLSSQMMTSVIGYTSAGKILTEKQTLGFNVKM